MKKFLISLTLIFSLFLSGCEFFPDSSDRSDSGTLGGESAGGATVATDGHADEDNNGKCDGCGESVLVELDFFVLNDFHGKMTDSSTQPGAEELSTYLRTVTASEPNAILLSSGDMWQGGSESNLTKGLIVTEWMNELDFVSMTLGNHEFDWGEEYIIENEELAEFPFLAINVYDSETNERVEYCQSSVVVERSGIQIGIIGAIGDCYSSIATDKTEEIHFKVGDELTDMVIAESERLRAEGVDLIVYSLHDGFESSKSSGTLTSGNLSSYYDTRLSSGNYVDIVLEAHTHQTYNLKDTYGVYHIQAGGENKAITTAEIYVNFANGNVVVSDTAIISNQVYSSCEEDAYFEILFEKYAEKIALGDVILGTNGSYRSGDELRQLIADLYYELGMEEFSDEYDIVLGGGYISVRSPYSLSPGDVKYSDLQSLFPFDNQLTLCSVSGYYLETKFFETSNSNYFISYGEYGEEVRNDIDYDETYYIITDSYSAYYAPNHLTVIEVYDPDVFARDLLAEYIKAGGLDIKNN